MVKEAEDFRLVLCRNIVRWQLTAFALNAGFNTHKIFSKAEYNKKTKKAINSVIKNKASESWEQFSQGSFLVKKIVNGLEND